MSETELSREAASKGRPDWGEKNELSSSDSTEFRCCNWDCQRVTEGDNNRHMPTSNILLDFTFLWRRVFILMMLIAKKSFQT